MISQDETRVQALDHCSKVFANATLKEDDGSFRRFDPLQMKIGIHMH